MKVTINNQTYEITEEQSTELKTLLGINDKKLSDIAIGDTFKVGDIEFIKFSEKGGQVVAVTKDSLFNSKFDDNSNNFATSYLLEKLTIELLPKIEAAVGAENVLMFETDLFSLSGSNEYGTLQSKISLPTLDFYRNNRAIFEKYKLNCWWWLSTPNETPKFENSNYWVSCVSPIGGIDYVNCNGISGGVRPFCIFNSSIYVSC